MVKDTKAILTSLNAFLPVTEKITAQKSVLFRKLHNYTTLLKIRSPRQLGALASVEERPPFAFFYMDYRKQFDAENIQLQIDDLALITDNLTATMAFINKNNEELTHLISASLDISSFDTAALFIQTQFDFFFSELKHAFLSIDFIVMASSQGVTTTAALSSLEYNITRTKYRILHNLHLTPELDLVRMSTFRTDSNIFILFLAPLEDKDRFFNIYEIIPFPTVRNNLRIEPINPQNFVAIHPSQRTFVPLSLFEVSLCFADSSFCSAMHPTFDSDKQWCGISSFFEKDTDCVFQESTLRHPVILTFGNTSCFSFEIDTIILQSCSDPLHPHKSNVSRTTVTGKTCVQFNHRCVLKIGAAATIFPSKISHLASHTSPVTFLPRTPGSTAFRDIVDTLLSPAIFPNVSIIFKSTTDILKYIPSAVNATAELKKSRKKLKSLRKTTSAAVAAIIFLLSFVTFIAFLVLTRHHSHISNLSRLLQGMFVLEPH